MTMGPILHDFVHENWPCLTYFSAQGFFDLVMNLLVVVITIKTLLVLS